MNAHNLIAAYGSIANWIAGKMMLILALASLFNGLMDITVGLFGYIIPSYVFGSFMLFSGIGLAGIAYAHSSEKNTKDAIELNLWQRLVLRVRGQVCIGQEIRPGWFGPIRFYAWRCPVHGLVKNYRRGYKGILDCPHCLQLRCEAIIRERRI